MRLRLAHFALCGSLLIGQQLGHAQQVLCASAPPTDEPYSGPEISISDVTFSGFIQMPISDQDAIAASLKRQRYAFSLDNVVEEALERVKAGWQDQGYFKAEVSGDAKTVTTSSASLQIALFVHIEENAQYRLSGISFKNNKVLSDSAKLRNLFPIKDGAIFGREKIAEGLDNLRKAYGEYGYINYTGVPNTTFDDEKKLASLEIDIDEGKQFYLTRVDILGLDESSRQEIMKDLPVGQIYNQRLFDLFLEKHASTFKFLHDDPSLVAKRLDERAGTVEISLDCRPCPVD